MIEFMSIPQLQTKNYLKIQNYSCFQGKPAFRICTNKDCTKPSICCKDFDCQCNKTHLDCPQRNLQSLLKKLYSKVSSNTQIMQKATKLFDNIIDRLSQISQETQKIIKKYGLREAQVNFLQYFENNCENKLTGKIVNDAIKNAEIKFQGDFGQIQKCVDKLWSEMDGIIWGVFYSTKDLYEIPLKSSKLHPNSGERFLGQIINQLKKKIAAVECNEFKIEKLYSRQNLMQKMQQKKQRSLGREIFLRNRRANLNLQKEISRPISNRNQQPINSKIINENKQPGQDLSQVQIQMVKEMWRNDFIQIEKQQQQSKIVQNQKNNTVNTSLWNKDQLKKDKEPNIQKVVKDQNQKVHQNKPNDDLRIKQNQKPKSRNSSWLNMFLRPNFLRQEVNRQTCQTLSEVCSISKQEAENFVRSNMVNFLGVKRSTQQIINLWWNKQAGMN